MCTNFCDTFTTCNQHWEHVWFSIAYVYLFELRDAMWRKMKICYFKYQCYWSLCDMWVSVEESMEFNSIDTLKANFHFVFLERSDKTCHNQNICSCFQSENHKYFKIWQRKNNNNVPHIIPSGMMWNNYSWSWSVCLNVCFFCFFFKSTCNSTVAYILQNAY